MTVLPVLAGAGGVVEAVALEEHLAVEMGGQGLPALPIARICLAPGDSLRAETLFDAAGQTSFPGWGPRPAVPGISDPGP